MSVAVRDFILAQAAEAALSFISHAEFVAAIGISARRFYYWQKQQSPSPHPAPIVVRTPPNKLKPEERKQIVALLLKPEWSDFSPREIYYKLLDEEQRLIASVSTFYRVAKAASLLGRRGAVTEGRKLNRETPHLVALAPNEVWSWDVSQIRSINRLERFYLYVIIDIWSRLVVGFCLETHEKTDLAIKLWKQALESQCITGKGLINHKDNGTIMTADDMIEFVKATEMIDSYSRAGVSDDNPFSESNFASIKRFRDFPDYFENIDSGRLYFEKYFKDYNFEYKHSGIQFLSPAVRHYGDEPKVLNARNKVITNFHAQNPHRYSKEPKTFSPILAVNIN